MSFKSPSMLVWLLAIPAFIAAYRAAGRRRTRRLEALAAEGLRPSTDTARRRFRRHVPFALFIGALTVLGVALAEPTATISAPHETGTAIVALDVSTSMRADDVKPSRIAIARADARAFVRRLSASVKVGVVAFGQGAAVVQAPTAVHADAIAAINRASVGGGTSLGQGLLTSLDTIAGKKITIDEQALQSDEGQVDVGYYGGATIVVFSDGENESSPDPLDVAKVVSVAGVRVHTIGVGTEAGTVLKVGGFSIATALNRDLLTEVASSTDGMYHASTDAAAAGAITRTIKVRLRLVSEHVQVTALFCAIAVLLLLVAALLSVGWFGRVA